jgi:hypothetical protein
MFNRQDAKIAKKNLYKFSSWRPWRFGGSIRFFAFCGAARV